MFPGKTGLFIGPCVSQWLDAYLRRKILYLAGSGPSEKGMGNECFSPICFEADGSGDLIGREKTQSTVEQKCGGDLSRGDWDDT